MNNLQLTAKAMRMRVYHHMLATRGSKYRAFLRYLRIFKFIACAPNRGEFLESYYTLMRYLDDIVDGDAPLPKGYCNTESLLLKTIAFARNLSDPKDEIDYLLIHCFETGKKFNADFSNETADILTSLLFDANRRGTKHVFPATDLEHHFHKLDIRGTIQATLKVFKEDPAKYTLLEPLGTACRYQYDLEDFEQDVAAGYINITGEDCYQLGIAPADFEDLHQQKFTNWKLLHARQGMELLSKHRTLLATATFSWLARATFRVVYEIPARNCFVKILSSNN
jgi:hypothetical protein